MGDTLWYRTRAYNGLGDSAYSGNASATLDDMLSAPPTDLVATPQGDDTVRVNATEPLDLPGGTTYTIEKAPDVAGSPGTWVSAKTGVTAFPDDVTGLSANEENWWRAKAVKAGLTDGPYSRYRKATTLVDRPQTVLSDHRTEFCPGSIVMRTTWSNDNADGDGRSEITDWEYWDGAWNSAGTAAAGAITKDITANGSTTKIRGKYQSETVWQETTFIAPECPA